MDTGVRRWVAGVFALGTLSFAVAAWLHVNGATWWDTVFVTIATALVAPALVAAFERRRGPVSFPALLFLLGLPALLTAPLVLGPWGGSYWSVPYEFGLAQALLWFALPLVVPYAYALGRTGNQRRQWLLAGAIALAALGTTNVLLATTPAINRVEQLGLATTVLALGTWPAVPLYHLGKAVGPATPATALLRHPPALLAGFVSVAITAVMASMSGGLVPLRSLDPIGLLVLYGPVVYFALRGVQLALDRRGGGVEERPSTN